MPTPRIEERWDSRNGSESVDSANEEIIYVIAYAADQHEAAALALADSPLDVVTVLGKILYRQSFDYEVSEGELYHVTIHYGPLKKPEVGDYDFSFDTAGGSEKRTQSIQTRNRYAASGEAPNYKGAIGVTRDSVEGVDLPTSGFKWTETHTLPIEQVTFAYSQVLKAMTHKINALAFRGFAPNTVCFKGAQGGKKDEGTGRLTFNFEANEHATDLSVGDIIGIEKRAWDYLWVRYEDKEDLAAKSLVKHPKAVYVEQMFYEADFSNLGIGS